MRHVKEYGLLCAIPSAGQFAVHGLAFSFAMRCCLGLPALMGMDPGAGMEAYAGKQIAINGRHDAATRAILWVCAGERKRTAVCNTTREPNG